MPTAISSTLVYFFAKRATRLESIPPEKDIETLLLQSFFTDFSNALLIFEIF